MPPKTKTCACLNIWIFLFVCLLYWEFVFLFNFILSVLISGLLVCVCLFVWVTEKNFTDVRATTNTLAATRRRYSPNGALLACSLLVQKVSAAKSLRTSCALVAKHLLLWSSLSPPRSPVVFLCLSLCFSIVLVYFYKIYMINIWVDAWLFLRYVIVAQVCMKDVLSVELILNMWKRELWQSGWLERSFVWQRGPCHILVKAFSVFPQTLISRLEKYGTGRTWRWMTGTKHRCVTAFSSLDPLAPCHLKGRRPCWWQSVQLFFEWSTQVALQIILVRSHYAR